MTIPGATSVFVGAGRFWAMSETEHKRSTVRSARLDMSALTMMILPRLLIAPRVV